MTMQTITVDNKGNKKYTMTVELALPTGKATRDRKASKVYDFNEMVGKQNIPMLFMNGSKDDCAKAKAAAVQAFNKGKDTLYKPAADFGHLVTRDLEKVGAKDPKTGAQLKGFGIWLLPHPTETA